MRVSIRHSEIERGLIFKKRYYRVITDVTFTEVELQVIKDGKHQNDIVLTRRLSATIGNPDEEIDNVSIARFMKGTDKWDTTSVLQAKDYENLLKEALTIIKENMNSAASGVEDTSFEL